MSATVEASSRIEEQLPLKPVGGGLMLRPARDVGFIRLLVFLLALLLAPIACRVHWQSINMQNRQWERALIADSGLATAGRLSRLPQGRGRRRSKRTNPSLAESKGLPPKRSRPSQ